VNKTETKVEISWDPEASLCLNERQKNRVKQRLSTRLTDRGKLILVSDRHRSQNRNKEEVTERFLQLVIASLVIPRKRHPTRPTRTSKEQRIRSKKIRGEIKRLRRDRPQD
jgi:ribosome-associated protein